MIVGQLYYDPLFFKQNSISFMKYPQLIPMTYFSPIKIGPAVIEKKMFFDFFPIPITR